MYSSLRGLTAAAIRLRADLRRVLNVFNNAHVNNIIFQVNNPEKFHFVLNAYPGNCKNTTSAVTFSGYGFNPIRSKNLYRAMFRRRIRGA